MASPPNQISTSCSSAVKYPCPLEVNVANFVPIKLGLKNYCVWERRMLDLIESHRLRGFVDGTIQPPRKEDDEEAYWSWKRSDILVRGWIFLVVKERMQRKLVRLETAREVWIAIHEILGSSDHESTHYESSDYDESDQPEFEDERAASRYLPLQKAVLNGDWEKAKKILEREPGAVGEAISLDSETVLMWAVHSSKRNHFVKMLLDKMSPDQVARPDINGETALHEAVACHNNEAARWLVRINPELPNIGNAKDGTLPVHLAATRGNREMVSFLLEVTKVSGDPNPFDEELGRRLLSSLAKGGFYDIASNFLQGHPLLASMKPSPLIEMCYQHSSFLTGTYLNFFERWIYSGIPLKLEGNANNPIGRGNANYPTGRDVENSVDGVVSPSGYCYTFSS
ncbi:hypothetical protein Vadar_018176 [Vaccinium darrowii]|uniref:Uncharacterized protein n=1 Tax=Vaccinium darrowii TaxID=229202 RepID=A0ACB7Y927_9ERIC|nr:hypothetical protein Vadar_018176 [Vaccinium darrowii]